MSHFTRVAVVLAAAALTATCSHPVCGCTPARTHGIVRGVVSAGGGVEAAAPGTRVRLTAVPTRADVDCAATARAQFGSGDAVTATGTAGGFRTEMFSYAGPGRHCVWATAYRGEPGASDSVTGSGSTLTFVAEGARAESVAVALTLPAPHAAAAP